MKNSLLIPVLSFVFLGLSAYSNIELFILAGIYGFPSSYQSPFEDQKAKPAGILANIEASIHLHFFIL